MRWALEKQFRQNDDTPEHKELHLLANIIEALLIEQIELNEWLGPNVNTMKTDPYDDYVNGIDFIAEFDRDRAKHYAGFAIDVTFAGNTGLENKFQKIRNGLHQGELGRVKYFCSSDKSFHGIKRFIPKIVLSLNKDLVLELAALWVKGEQRALNKHPAMTMFKEEIVSQLRIQQRYIEELQRRKHLFPSQAQPMIAAIETQLSFLQPPDPKDIQTPSELCQRVLSRLDRILKQTFSLQRIDMFAQQITR